MLSGASSEISETDEGWQSVWMRGGPSKQFEPLARSNIAIRRSGLGAREIWLKCGLARKRLFALTAL